MLKRMELLPKEHLMKKYSQIMGMTMFEVSEVVDREGIETIADVVEEHLLMESIRGHQETYLQRK